MRRAPFVFAGDCPSERVADPPRNRTDVAAAQPLAAPSVRLRACFTSPRSTEFADGHIHGWPSQTTFVRGAAQTAKKCGTARLSRQTQEEDQCQASPQMGD